MRQHLISTTLCLAATALFWSALNSSLVAMTVNDCLAGVPAACREVNK